MRLCTPIIRLRRLVYEEQAQGTVEYALIIGLLVLAAVGGLASLGGGAGGLYDFVQNSAHSAFTR